MFQTLARELLCCAVQRRHELHLLTVCDPVIIMSVGASRIYRGLVDHPALSQHSTKAAVSGEWLNRPPSVPVTSSYKGHPAEGIHAVGGLIFTQDGQPFEMFDSQVAKIKDDKLV